MLSIVSLGMSLIAFSGVSTKFPVETHIGGLSIETRWHQSRIDSKRQLFLVSRGECDGAHRRLTLSTDEKAIMLNEGYLYDGLDEWNVRQSVDRFRKELEPASIAARTNRGIRLGMTEHQVKQILGSPTKSMFSKKFQARELIYRHEVAWPKHKQDPGGLGTGVSYRNYFLFRNGQLFYIEIARDVVGGAC